jgi:hypothetical protein
MTDQPCLQSRRLPHLVAAVNSLADKGYAFKRIPITGADAQLAAANRIIAQQTAALACAHSALLHAKDAIAYSFAEAFEVDGRSVSDAIREAVATIEGRAP